MWARTLICAIPLGPAFAQVELLYLFLKKVMKEMKGKEQLVNEKKEKYHFQSL